VYCGVWVISRLLRNWWCLFGLFLISVRFLGVNSMVCSSLSIL